MKQTKFIDYSAGISYRLPGCDDRSSIPDTNRKSYSQYQEEISSAFADFVT